MKNLDIEKFNKAFEKTLSCIGNDNKISLYHEINKTIQLYTDLNRVTILSFPFEKIVYQIVKSNGSYNRPSYYRYNGVLEKEGLFYNFHFFKDRLVSSAELLKEAYKVIKPFKYSVLKDGIDIFNGLVLSNVKETLKNSIFIYNKNGKEAFQKEMHAFYNRYIINIFNKKRVERIFKASINRKISPETRKYSYALSGKALSFTNDITKLFSDNPKEEVIELLEDYSLLFPLFAKEIEIPLHEQKVLTKFEEKRDKKLSLIQSIKNYFQLTEEQMLLIKKTSWQKFPFIKNRPAILIDLIKKGLDPTKIKNKKEAYSVYLFYYYFECNNRFVFSNVDYNKIKDLRIKKEDILLFKEMNEVVKEREKKHRIFITNSFVKKMQIEDPEGFILRIRQEEYKKSYFKENFEIKGKRFSLKEESASKLEQIYTVNNSEEYLLRISSCSADEINISVKRLKGTELDLSNEIEELIKFEYSKLFNKRYKIFTIINRENLCLSYLNWFPNKKMASLINYFCVFLIKDDETYVHYRRTKLKINGFKEFYECLTEKPLSDDITLLDII